ncbi:putative N-acetyltransferase san-like protein [Sporodiniella umbellata]|nr:putative N-acetyltransferase san-like protein [Sporodiniella umbellata]
MLIAITPRISLVDVTLETLPQLKELHKRVFPVTYGSNFYEYVLNSGDLAKLIYYDNYCVGGICCRLERDQLGSFTAKLYMMTLGILWNYRSLGLGRILIDYILNVASRATNPFITSIYLHAQTTNEKAIRFYLRNGFRIEAIEHDYYKLNESKDAYILTRPIVRF